MRKNFYFILFQLLIIPLLSFQITLVNADGEDSANAIQIELGDTAGSLPGLATDGSIWYVISLLADHYQFSLTGPGGTDFDLDLYDSNEDYIDGAYDEVYPDKFFVLDLGTGDYYINVYANTGTGAFTLNIATYTRVDGDYYDNAIRINLGDTTGIMPGPGSSGEIYYYIRLAAGDYQFSLTGPGGTDFNLYLFDSSSNIIGLADDVVYPDILAVPNLKTDTYLIVIFPDTGTGDFTLYIGTYTPGDSPENAIHITLGNTVGEMLGPGINNELWYVISLPTGGIKFSLTGPDGTDFNLNLYDSDSILIGSAADTVYPDILTILDLESANYFISILPITGTGAFTLTITDVTPGKSSDNPIVIGLGETTGSMPGPALDGSIWYVIPLTTGDYQFSLTGPGGTNFDLDVMDSAFYWIGGTFGEEYPEILIISDLEAGDYYITVLASIGTGSFTLNITKYIPGPVEPPVNITVIELGETVGSLPGPATDGSIMYNITLLAGNYQCSLTGPEGTDFNLELYDSTMVYISGTYDINYPDILTAMGLKNGIYYIRILSKDGLGSFTLTVSEYIPTTITTPTTTVSTAIIPITTASTTPVLIVSISLGLTLNSIIVIRRRHRKNIF